MLQKPNIFYRSKGKFSNLGSRGSPSQLSIRAFSTSIKQGPSVDGFGLRVFSDADKDKLDVLNYTKGKAGVYMWTNKSNAKKYVGSSVNLRRRWMEYYNVNRLLN